MNFQCLKFNFLISEICFPISENSDYLMLAIVFFFWQNVTTGPLLKVLQWELKEYNPTSIECSLFPLRSGYIHSRAVYISEILL